MKPPTQTTEEWAAEQIAADAPAKAPKGIPEDDIAAKVAAGLTRDQAIEVLKAQAQHDASLAETGIKADKPTKKKP